MNLYRKRHPIAIDDSHCIHVPGFRPTRLEDGEYTPAPPYNYRITSLVTSQLNVEYGLTINLPATFQNELSGDVMFYLLELMALLPEAPHPSEEFQGLVWGLGVRVGIAMTRLDNNLTASIAGVAASSTLGFSNANYAVRAEGLGPGVIGSAGPFFKNILGSFNAEHIQSLGEGLQAISTYLVEETKDREPVPVYAISETPKTELSKIHAVSACYALNSIARVLSYDKAQEQLDHNHAYEQYVNLLEVKSIYREIVNEAGSGSPTKSQTERAKLILELQGHH